MTIAGLVPMRHHSERVLGKNYRPFAGKPLYHHIVSSLLATPEIDWVVINTDSPFISEEVPKKFPNVVVLERPENLRDGTIPMNDVLLHIVTQVEADYYVQTHSTNPLLRPETISKGIRLFLENQPEYDSLFSVTRLQTRLWDKEGRPMNHNPAVLMRTQDLPPVYEENSCLYIFTRETMLAFKNRIGEQPLMFEIDADEVVDIDEELDFRFAEFLYHEREKS